ncbi:hypothetical protein [Actinomycetospora cinnamomea]|uniref:Uncharacterized protein n=1 Tax=Actinomycetospora cinnamomea TaxID=663609 RepID=A0A2U1FAA3_9PSEU|nr:hypothetical protein [Actinomycetospora cinnamomea]PVZ08900.1 hypothetical protein C8D89_10762 [Actinomycetospora cinnamomea]
MGRRRRDERRTAAARRRRRRVAARPPRGARRGRASTVARRRDGGGAAPGLGALLDGIVGGLDDDAWEDEADDAWDDSDEDDWDDSDDSDDSDEDFELLRDWVRVVLGETVDQRDGEIARAFVTGLRRPPALADLFPGPSQDRVLVDLVVDSWLGKARRRHPDEDLARRAVAWVREVLGESGPVVEDAARVLWSSGAEVLREDFLRTPDDVLVARLWLLAAVLALAPVDDAVRCEVLHGR